MVVSNNGWMAAKRFKFRPDGFVDEKVGETTMVHYGSSAFLPFDIATFGGATPSGTKVWKSPVCTENHPVNRTIFGFSSVFPDNFRENSISQIITRMG